MRAIRNQEPKKFARCISQQLWRIVFFLQSTIKRTKMKSRISKWCENIVNSWNNPNCLILQVKFNMVRNFQKDLRQLATGISLSLETEDILDGLTHETPQLWKSQERTCRGGKKSTFKQFYMTQGHAVSWIPKFYSPHSMLLYSNQV